MDFQSFGDSESRMTIRFINCKCRETNPSLLGRNCEQRLHRPSRRVAFCFAPGTAPRLEVRVLASGHGECELNGKGIRRVENLRESHGAAASTARLKPLTQFVSVTNKHSVKMQTHTALNLLSNQAGQDQLNLRL
jgi:hypothetical protein